MARVRLTRVRELREQIEQLQAGCHHRFVNDDCRLPVKPTPVTGLYFDKTEF